MECTSSRPHHDRRLIGNYMADHGFEYIVGSSMVTVSSSDHGPREGNVPQPIASLAGRRPRCRWYGPRWCGRLPIYPANNRSRWRRDFLRESTAIHADQAPSFFEFIGGSLSGAHPAGSVDGPGETKSRHSQDESSSRVRRESFRALMRIIYWPLSKVLHAAMDPLSNPC